MFTFPGIVLFAAGGGKRNSLSLGARVEPLQSPGWIATSGRDGHCEAEESRPEVAIHLKSPAVK